MQVPRHWREQRFRYQLLGQRNPDGSISLANRPQLPENNSTKPEVAVQSGYGNKFEKIILRSKERG